MTQPGGTHLLRCQCGAVECTAHGAPILTTVCYCDDCQAAATLLEALPGAPAIRDADGGTVLTLFRANRFAPTKGADKLVAHKLKPESITSRMVASCCNSAMYLSFDKGPHWVSTLRNRLVGEKPPVKYRVMTRYRTSTLPYPDTAPTAKGFSLRFLGSMIRDAIAMKLGR
jgi:hypothetical protein